MEERKLDLEKQIERLANSIGWIDSECAKIEKDKNPDVMKYPELLKKRMDTEELLRRYEKELEFERAREASGPFNQQEQEIQNVYTKGNDIYISVRVSYIRLKDN
ncbi:hypothetical protein P872_11870 [Rhodonellum psychrophilum GCM71 = DSM 17998]|uniref:Peptide chain release factor domain-containing protein n=2 Tax=Rhodonellum TaxID=336827 RepID=U5BY94_9BACT|nr:MULTISPECIES: hypothetical protein [Rhodonellum]ERM80847.1 hypothetical protein P872_11870 [Rhodonellum psychrophilum GCM71 = DSM 17998]SDZ52610.1 hypothetical protein SAMN05444412_12041 [Rhodonellum ikkaensis]